MQRLTHKELNSLGNVYFTKCAYRDCGGHCICCDIPDEAEHKLKEYEDLEEQGLLLKLPCKVGDSLYYIEDYEIYHDKVNRIEISKEKGEYIFCIAYMDWIYDDFGKTVFLTKEEAKEALRKKAE